MNDVLILPLNDSENLVVSTDNSGAIGMKPDDVVQVSYDIVAYFSFRVAVMECLAAGAMPISVVLHNFCSEESWGAMNEGIHKGVVELGLNEIPVIGSTESNFQLLQSAVGITVLGKQDRKDKLVKETIQSSISYAIIGRPLVGNEVMKKNNLVAPLSLFRWMCEQEEITHVVPVGSKGILYKLNQLDPHLTSAQLQSDIDLLKSSGPSTCFIIAYHSSFEEKIMKKAGSHFYKI